MQKPLLVLFVVAVLFGIYLWEPNRDAASAAAESDGVAQEAQGADTVASGPTKAAGPSTSPGDGESPPADPNPAPGSRGADPQLAPSGAQAPSAEPGEPGPADGPAASAEGEAEPKADGIAANLTKEEAALVAMYGQMAAVLSANQANCDDMAAQVDALVERNLPAAKRLRTARTKLDPEAQQKAEDRVQEAAAEPLNEVRELIRKSMTKCAGNDSLMAALRRLASAGFDG